MDALTLIQQRRSIKDFQQHSVPRDLLEKVLSAGIWAQNHRLTQPWRFTILGPESLQKLGAAAAAAQTIPATATEAEVNALRNGASQKFLSKPQIVIASMRLTGDASQQKEDYAAVACSIQNIALLASAEGLGMMWSTTRMSRHPDTYQLAGIDPKNEEIVGFLYFGYPLALPPAPARKPLSEVCRSLP